jgi:hypothetical protein
MAAHHAVLFPYARQLYRSVGKSLPRDPVGVWAAALPAPEQPAGHSEDKRLAAVLAAGAIAGKPSLIYICNFHV